MIQADTLIIGAGVIGSSVAMHLAQRGGGGIRVIDFDLEGSLSSSELNAGGVRATLSQPLNIEMSRITIDYFATVAEEVGYRPCGYLWLYREDRLAQALKARELQIKMGWPVEAWDVAELRRRMPLIDKADDLAGAVFGSRDGLVNPNLLKNHYRQKARNQGVVFDDRTLLRSVEYTEGGIRVIAERFAPQLAQDGKMEVLTGKSTASLRPSEVEYRVQQIVNCAGPWAGQVAEALGYKSPTFAVRRQISIFDCEARNVEGPRHSSASPTHGAVSDGLASYGMIIDPSGVYFHPEAMNMLAGFANHDEPSGFNYHYDGEQFFMERIWPALYERSSVFERLKHLTGWSGLYEVSPDECSILGQVAQGVAGKSGRVYEAHSFSGHGVMHSYSAGQSLAELMTSGKFETVDASGLSARRFETGQLMREGLVI
jgi:sarcosine oxidase subunit beta